MNIHAPGAFRLDFFYKEAAMPCGYKESILVCSANNARFRKNVLAWMVVNDLRREEAQPLAG